MGKKWLAVCIYCIVLIILTFCFLGNTDALKYLYILDLIISALFLITIGIEDNKTLHVSWRNTTQYIFVCVPGVVTGIVGGFLAGQVIYYIAGAVFALVLIIYSSKTGRGGADRDIGIISIAAFPMIAVLSLVPALIMSVIYTAKKKRKFPMLFPFSIVFGLLALVQIVILF